MLAEVELSSFVRNAESTLRMSRDTQLRSLLPSFQKLRSSEFSELNYRLAQKRSEVMMVLEKYEIASPELTIFRTALNVVTSDIMDRFQPLFMEYVKVMSVEVPEVDRIKVGTDIIHKEPPSDEVMDRIGTISEAFINRENFKFNRTAALAEWRQLAA